MGVRHVLNEHVRLIQRVGENLLEVFQENRNAFELMDHDGLLTEFYGSNSGFGPAYYYLQHCIAPFTHRYQNMDILEIGITIAVNILHLLTSSRCGYWRSDQVHLRDEPAGF
jgi:hybrid polyketide synthase/nonribosomal peptide synthetase ACE1